MATCGEHKSVHTHLCVCMCVCASARASTHTHVRMHVHVSLGTYIPVCLTICIQGRLKKRFCIKWLPRSYLWRLFHTTAAAAKSLQSCLTLCDPIDGSPPGSPVPGILQARTLEWVAISFSSAWKWKVNVKSFSRVRPLATPWTAAYQAPPSMGFSRQEY